MGNGMMLVVTVIISMLCVKLGIKIKSFSKLNKCDCYQEQLVLLECVLIPDEAGDDNI